ncbi:hypothetical protein C0995_012159 [Termitomyces sp. Mi166|nr:hypothetical protein C0995_012159 [Termitomyces sp. Mi166\
MSSFVHVFEAVLHKLATTADFGASVLAPLDTDGANIPTNAWDKRVTELFQVLRRPAASLRDIVCMSIDFVSVSAQRLIQPAVLDAIENAQGVGLDDRLLLLEDVLVLMSRLPSDSALSAKVQQYVISLLYNDLPHPPSGYTAEFDALNSSIAAAPATKGGLPVTYAYRSADGSNYNPLAPSLGKARSPYARSVSPNHVVPKYALPDPGLVFDEILRRKKYIPHPGGISSLFFAFADLVIHSIFDTDYRNPTQNDASSYLDLSILYGSSDSDVDQVRRKDGTGKLWDDVFSDARLLLMPPATCALLVLLNRNHNYIAQKLLDINENGTYASQPKTVEDLRIQDDEIFQRTRLINCGFFMNIILGDYVGAILGLVVDGTGWRLDPLMDMRESDHSVSPRGKGNAVSIEFNLMYRWHATLSEQDAEWTEQEFTRFFHRRDLNEVTPQEFIRVAREALSPEPDVKKRTFGGLERQPDGRFKDDDLARIIQNATEWRAAAYSSGCPEALRVIEILAIEQSRTWGTCSINEFRKFLGLKRELLLSNVQNLLTRGLLAYSTFSEWNPDPVIHKAAEALYKDIDNLELHVGLQAEECKKLGPGAGLCPGYTISRAILADAVALTRGDPYLTTEFNTKNCTQWGYADVQYDKRDGSYGGLLTKLLFRTLPNNYPVGSVYAHFPFLVPDYIREKNPKVGNNPKYIWERPSVPSSKTVDVNTYVGARQVLEDPSFLSGYSDRLFNVRPEELKDLSKTAFFEGCATVERLISSPHPRNSSGVLVEYFQKETKDLISDKFVENFDRSRTVDVVQDVINLLPVHWIAEEIFGLPLKTQSNQRGAINERDAYRYFAALGRYALSNIDPVNDWHLRLDSEEAFQKLFYYVKGRLDEINHQVSFSALRQRFIDRTSVESPEHSREFAARVIAEFQEPKPNAELAAYTIAAIVPTAAYFSQAITNVVYFYLPDDKKEERAEIVRLSASIDRESTSEIMTYVYEALPRLTSIDTQVYGIFRTAGADIPVPGFGTIKWGDRAYVDLFNANLDATAFGPNPSTAVYDRSARGLFWNESGTFSLLSPAFFESTVPIIIGTILGLKNVRRTAGNQGTLAQIKEKRNEIERQFYIDEKGKVTPFPPSLKINVEQREGQNVLNLSELDSAGEVNVSRSGNIRNIVNA